MGQGGQDSFQILHDSFAAAGQVDDDALSQHAGHSAGDGRMGRLGQAGLHHGHAEAGQGIVQHRGRDLRRDVARAHARTAAGADDVIALVQGQIHQQGAQLHRIIGQQEALAVAQGQGIGHQGGHGRAAGIVAHALGALVRKGHPGQGTARAPRLEADLAHGQVHQGAGHQTLQGVAAVIGGQPAAARDAQQFHIVRIIQAGAHRDEGALAHQRGRQTMAGHPCDPGHRQGHKAPGGTGSQGNRKFHASSTNCRDGR